MSEPYVTVRGADRGAGLVSLAGMALARAMAGEGDLPEWLRLLPGLSGQRFRLFCNTLLRALPGAHLLEIGSGTGSSAFSAVWQTQARVTTIDNWIDGRAGLASFHAYRTLLRNREAVIQIDQDFRAADYAAIGPAEVFFYDGPLNAGDVTDALRLVQPGLAPQHVLIIDDWNHDALREEALAAIRDLGLPVIWSVELRTTLDGSHPAVGGEESDWHNGYFIAVIDRTRPATTPDTATTLSVPWPAAHGAAPAVVPVPAHVAAGVAADGAASPEHLRAVMLDFESLGDNCELGLVQRSVGAEPLGLLRFAGLFLPSEIRLRKTIEGLRRRFEGLGEAGTVRIVAEGDRPPREYVVREAAYELMYHTFKHEGEADPGALERQQRAGLRYLRQKLIDDLASAQKLCVWRSPIGHDVGEVTDLLATLRDFGAATLLWVGPQSLDPLPDGRRLGPEQGTARWLAPNLIKGTVSRLSPYENAGDIDYGSWYAMLTEAHRLWRAQRPPAVN